MTVRDRGIINMPSHLEVLQIPAFATAVSGDYLLHTVPDRVFYELFGHRTVQATGTVVTVGIYILRPEEPIAPGGPLVPGYIDRYTGVNDRQFMWSQPIILAPLTKIIVSVTVTVAGSVAAAIMLRKITTPRLSML